MSKSSIYPSRFHVTDFGRVGWFGAFEAVSCRLLYELPLFPPVGRKETKMSCSKRVPGLGIVRRYRMVSPQEGHIRIGALSGTNGEHSKAGIEGE
jgi:hypothetical protein